MAYLEDRDKMEKFRSIIGRNGNQKQKCILAAGYIGT